MEFKVPGVVRGGPARVLVVAFSQASNADEVSAAVDHRIVRKAEVTLRWLEGTAGTDRGPFNGTDPGWEPADLSDCASGAYWRTRDNEEG